MHVRQGSTTVQSRPRRSFPNSLWLSLFAKTAGNPWLIAHFEELEFAGGEEGFEEGFLDESVVFATEGEDAIVVRMGVGPDEADGDILPGGVFDPAEARIHQSASPFHLPF